MRIAAVDLGSNSFHLVVAEVQPDGTFTPLIREKETLRLGDAVSREGQITPTAADAAVRTMRRFRMLAEAAGAHEIVARATSALRSASNGAAVLDRIEAEAGVGADVIDGLEEARLIFGAIRAAVLIEPGPALCLDVGGGSVEIMVGDASRLLWAASERIGVARLTTRFVHSDPISKADRRRLHDHLVAVLEPLAVEAKRFEPTMTIGSSGTLQDLAAMAAARRSEPLPVSLNHLTVTREELVALHDVLLCSTAAERRHMDGLDAKRVDLVVAGSILLVTALELFDARDLTISSWALREGIVLDAIGRRDPADWSGDPRAIRRASVQSLARRCSWPERHSRHVARLALELFAQLRDLHGLDDRDRELLEYAALLHDIGEHVARESHERHGAYLIANGELRGFDPDEVQMMTAVVRWHRRGEPRPDPFVSDLDPDRRDRVRRLTAILRVADGLDRSRRQIVTGVTARASPVLVLLRLRTNDDAELELWGARRKRDLFEKVFDRELEVTAHPSG